jgi:lipopolysaccharide transport system ATP-binding protein
MSKDVILKVENLSKQYRLGEVGVGTISDDLKRWWYKIRGKKDPFLKIGDVNDRASVGDSSYVWALQEIDFKVNRGEVLGIIGKNGAGKSTLLKILSRVTGPTLGTVKSKGKIASLLEVGTGFHPELTGRENVFLNGAIMGMSKKEIADKLEEIIDFSGCQRYIDTPTKRYSSGMKVRLAFAVAAHLEPDILVIDEVLAVGDAEFQKKAIGKMQDIASGDGRTVLFVSHNMTAVQNLCTRAIIIDKGRVSFDGDVDEAIQKYISENNTLSTSLLKEREDRSGNGLLKFTDIEFNNGSPVFLGKELLVKLHFVAKEKIENLDLAITICKGYEERLLTIDNVFQGEQLTVQKGEGYISVLLPKIYFLSGLYSVNIWSAQHGSVLDYVINGASLKIEDNDVYGTGKILSSKKHGVVYSEKCTWEVKM